MRILSLLEAFLWFSQLCLARPLVANASLEDSPLSELRSFLEANSIARRQRKPVYTEDNVELHVSIPQYNTALNDYEGSPLLNSYHKSFEKKALPFISNAEANADQDTLVYLADLYMFGESDIRPNYTKALNYYQRAVELAPHGHAYFMLGFIYSTGMFGEIPKDKAKSNLYYHFASENGNLNATIVLANKYYHGIDRPPNCDLAKFYYSRVARYVKSYQLEHGLKPDTGNPLHNIRLSDFNGGLYGPKLSNQILSFQSSADSDEAVRLSLEEMDYNHDPELREFYYAAAFAYTGTRFKPMNHSASFTLATKCVAHAQAKYGKISSNYVSSRDKNMWSRCLSLIGNMYYDGGFKERDLSKAYRYYKLANTVYDSGYTRTRLGRIHFLDPMTHGALSDNCTNYFKLAAEVDNSVARYYLAAWLSTHDPEYPFLIQNTPQTFTWWQDLSNRRFYNAHFYYADAMESGQGKSPTDIFYCSNIVDTYKQYVELSELILFPHLKYAFKEFAHGYYKNALLGYLLAAEQGLMYSQVSAAYLLYQNGPLLSWNPKSFDAERLLGAMSYLELASLQGDVDATILLGDIHYNGIKSASLPVDYGKAFKYYERAASAASPHGCFKLGYMYEFGLGSANATVDYHLAKRYYDLSLKYTTESQFFKVSRLNTYPMSLALLRLRVKLLFSRSKKDVDKAGWFSTFKKLSTSKDSMEDEKNEEKAIKKSTAHFEGGDYEGEDQYEIFDYVVLLLTVIFFVFVFILNMRGQLRRAGNNQNQPNQEGIAAAPNAFGFRRGNFEFHFFAL